MKVCLYGASSNELEEKYRRAAYSFGEALAGRGHSLVFGGGNTGLMGAAARGAASRKGEIIGIAPRFFDREGVLYPECTEMIYTETMRERKLLMEETSDAFVMVPGGIGTLDEFFEILTLKQLGRHKKPIAVFNAEGYYDELLAFLEKAVRERFFTDGGMKLFFASQDVSLLLDYLEWEAGRTGVKRRQS